MDASFLKAIKLFEGLTTAQLEKIASIGIPLSFEPGAFVFREGDRGDAMYIIVSGRVRISKTVPGMGEEALAILDPGHYFGEMALIEDQPRSADAIAHNTCALVQIERVRLDQLLFTDKDLAYVILWTFVRTLSERLRETDEKLKAFFALSRF